MKNITRTIKSMQYPIVKLGMEGGQITSEFVGYMDAECKLSDRELKKRIKSTFGEGKYTALEPVENEIMYSMPIDQFMRLATVVPPKPETAQTENI